MINIKKIAFLLIGIAFSINAIAQSPTIERNDYVVLTKNISQLNVIMASSKALKADDGAKFGDFQVIICGETVKALSDEKTVKDIKAKAEEANIKIVICGFSLDSFQMDGNAISNHLEIVDNGLLYNFQLQKKGFISIEL
jgi:intracellular sulfur oxidation DsrE/DsrF family protein